MATLAAGLTTIIILDAGKTLFVDGVFELSYQSGQVQSFSGPSRLGPFNISTRISIKAISDTNYQEESKTSGAQKNPVSPIFGSRQNSSVIIRPTNIGTRIFSGRVEKDFDNNSAYTWEVLIALEKDFDAVRVIFGQGRNAGATTTAATMLASCAALADTSSATSDAATWTAITVASSGTWSLAVGPGTRRRSFAVSDWIAVSSVSRTDGGSKPLLAVRGWVNGGAVLTLNGNTSGTDSFTNWATKPDGRIWKMRKASGNYASTNQANFGAAAAATNESPVIGVQYVARGRVITVMSFGDSIYDGRTTYLGESFVCKAVESKSDTSGVAWEYANLSWSGLGSTAFLNNMTDVFSAGIIPDIAVFPVGSPNDITTTISASQVNTARFLAAQMQALCRTNNVVPVLCSWAPSNTSAKNYGSSDSLRAAAALDVENMALTGSLAAPTSTAIAGATSSGQVQMVDGSNADGIHPNDYGENLMTDALISQLDRIYF